MIDVRQAVASAVDYANGFGNLLPSGGMRLEETELVDDGSSKVWLVTLSFIDNTLIQTRSFKQFEVEAETGQVRAMKARISLATKA